MIFGENNFVVRIIWKKRSTPPNDKIIGAAHEYALVYAKNVINIKLNLRERTKEQIARYKNPDNQIITFNTKVKNMKWKIFSIYKAT